MRDAVSSAELVGTHVKDQTGLGGPNSLKLKVKVKSRFKIQGLQFKVRP